jgi:hypothetical protein
MARICLITPGQLATNPRLVKEADALAAHGHDVVVITGCFVAWACEADLCFADRPWRLIARLPFGPMAPWPTRLCQTLGHRLARMLWRCGARGPRLEARAWHPLSTSLIRRARRIPADLYIAHYPAALPAAALAAKRNRAQYGFDAEDFHLGDPPEDPAYDRQRQLTRQLEGRWLPGAASVTAASPGIAAAYARAYGIAEPITIRNVFSLNEAPAAATPSGSAFPGPTLYWFSQTVGPDRGLECAIQALALSKSRPYLVLRGLPSSGYRTALETLAAQHGVAGHLQWHYPAPPDTMVRLAAQHDLGLVAETGSTPNHRIALANKLFTYALAGIPMLLSDIPAHRQILPEAGEAAKLFAVDDPISLAKTIDHWLAAPASVLAGARAAAYRLGQEHWNWEQEQQILINVVATAIINTPNF